MLRSIIITGLVIVFFQTSSGQTTQLKFNVSSAFNLGSRIDTRSNSLDSSSVEPSRDSLYREYRILGKKWGAIGAARKNKADSIEKAELDSLKASDDDIGLEIYKKQKNAIIARHNTNIKAAISAFNMQEAFYFQYRTLGKFNHIFQDSGFVKNEIDAQMFYDDQVSDKRYSLLNSTSLSFGNNGSTASIYNELFADYMGPLRVGIGILISNQASADSNSNSPSDSVKTQNSAIQQLLGGGGNGVLSLSYPLISYQTLLNRFNFKMFFSPKASADIPKIGTATNSPAFNYDFGGEAGLYYSGIQEVITVYAHMRTGYVGGSTEFYAGLNKPDEKAFVLNQLSIGIAVTSLFRISWNTYFGDSFVNKNFRNTVSVAISP